MDIKAERIALLSEVPTTSTLRTPSFDLLAETGEGELTAELDRRMSAGDSAPGPQIPPPVEPDVPLSLDYGSYEDGLIEDAKANVGAGEYGLARQQLDEVLAADPAHQEARYLTAYCLYRTGGRPELTEALELLCRLLTESPEDGLRVSVQELRAEVRRIRTPEVVREFLRAAEGSPGPAMARLRAYLLLAPEEGTCSYALATVLASRGEIEAAVRAAEAGAATATQDRDLVAGLARALRLRLLLGHAAPAVTAFRRERYADALRNLTELPREWQRVQVVLDFADHILRIQRGETDAPPLPRERLDDLYELIAGTDLAEAARLINADSPEEAERVVTSALRHAPGHPRLNFALAVCVLVQGGDLDRAEEAVNAARADPGLTEAAELAETIAQRRAVRLINAAIEEYVSIMDSATSVPAAPEPLREARRRLLALRDHLPELRRSAAGPDGDESVRSLGRAVDRNLAQIEPALLVARFNAVAGAAYPFPPANRKRRLQEELAEIVRDTRQLRRTADDAKTRRLLQQLEQSAQRLRLRIR